MPAEHGEDAPVSGAPVLRRHLEKNGQMAPQLVKRT